MSVQYRHDYIELCSLSGGQILVDPALRGITINKEHPASYNATRDFTLYQFSQDGRLVSTKRYDLYLGLLQGNTVDSDRMVSDLNAMPVGQLFAIVTYDEPSHGHAVKYSPSGEVPNTELIDAMERVGASRSLYAKPWRFWCAYMIVGKVGSPPYYELLDETPRPDQGDNYGNGVIRQSFSIINGKYVEAKYQNRFMTNVIKNASLVWKEGQRIACRIAGKWSFGRRVFIKANGVWKRIYIRNAVQVMSLGLAQTVIPPRYSGLYINGKAASAAARSYTLVQFNDLGEMVSTSGYDIFFDGSNGGTTHTNRMVADLDAMPLGQLFVIFTYDEPLAGHLNPTLIAAMERVGATSAVFGQPMAYRGAYMLIGKVGYPSYFEAYKGESVGEGGSPGSGGDPNAAIVKLFTIHNGEILFMPDTWTWGDPVPSLP